MIKTTGVGLNGLLAKVGKRLKPTVFVCLALLVSLSAIVSPLLAKNASAASGSADLILYDATTSHRTVKNDKKTVIIKAFIAGPSSQNGYWPDISEDNIRVFGQSDFDGEYGFEIDYVAPIAVEDDPHYGMYEVKARGRPKYLGSAPYSYNISFCALLEGETEMHCAIKNFSSSSSSNPRGETISFSASSTEVVLNGFPDPEAEEDDAEKTCRTENGMIGVVLCPLVDLLSSAMSNIYEAWIGNWLKIEPRLFTFQPGDDGEITHEVWSRLMTVANVVMILFMLIIIISQITGFGISNYGIKKALPKILIGILLINTSYYLCQAAIDVSNIVGNGIGDFIENISSDLVVHYSFKIVGSTLLAIVGSIGVIVAACAINPGFIVLIIGVLLAGLLAMFTLSVTLGIRQAATIILVVTSPLMVVCYAVPGLKSIYKRWFDLFKMVLIAYPIASLVVYGSALGGRILLIAWGERSTLGIIAAQAVIVVPYFMLPKIIMNCLGGLTTLTAKLQNSVKSNVAGIYNRSGVKSYLDNKHEQNKINRLAGIKFDKDGNVQARKRLKWMPFTAGMRSEYLQQAMNLHGIDVEHQLMQEDKNYFDDRQMGQRVADLTNDISGLNMTAQQLGANFSGLATSLGALNPSTNPDDANALRNGQAMAAAYARIMGASSAGRKELENVFRTPAFNQNTTSPGVEAMTRGTAMGVTGRDLASMAHSNPILAAHLQNVRNDYGTAGTYDSTAMTPQMLRQLSMEDWGKLDADTRTWMMHNAETNPNSAGAAAFNQYMEEVAGNAVRGNTSAPEVQNTGSNAQIADAMEYVRRREDAIDAGVAALNSAGTSSGQLTGAYNQDYAFYLSQFKEACNNGDLVGMEAAEKALRARATGETSGMSTENSEQFMRDFNTGMDAVYQEVIGQGYASNFKVGADRDAVYQQVALFRGRQQGKKG